MLCDLSPHQSSPTDREAEFLPAFSPLLFYLVHIYEKAPEGRRWGGGGTMLSASAHLRARRSGERIFYPTLSLFVETSGRLRLPWHTRWSAARARVIMTALLVTADVPVHQWCLSCFCLIPNIFQDFNQSCLFLFVFSFLIWYSGRTAAHRGSLTVFLRNGANRFEIILK